MIYFKASLDFVVIVAYSRTSAHRNGRFEFGTLYATPTLWHGLHDDPKRRKTPRAVAMLLRRSCRNLTPFKVPVVGPLGLHSARSTA
jgi:hypothetical protein